MPGYIYRERIHVGAVYHTAQILFTAQSLGNSKNAAVATFQLKENMLPKNIFSVKENKYGIVNINKIVFLSSKVLLAVHINVMISGLYQNISYYQEFIIKGFTFFYYVATLDITL